MLKRAARLPYLDLSMPERPLRPCERELSLNRRAAPQLYRAVHGVTRRANAELAPTTMARPSTGSRSRAG
jgi:aminoglycoside phosphotransferase family enzyme